MDHMAIDQLLEPIRRLLAVDGYELTTTTVGEQLQLSVRAGPDACEECLVARELFVDIVRDALSRSGVEMPSDAIVAHYPVDEIGDQVDGRKGSG